jgi:hypothetical protein
MQDNQDAETSTVKVQRENKRTKRILVEARYSAPVQTDPAAHPASCTMGNGVYFPRVKWPGVPITTHAI